MDIKLSHVTCRCLATGGTTLMQNINIDRNKKLDLIGLNNLSSTPGICFFNSHSTAYSNLQAPFYFFKASILHPYRLHNYIQKLQAHSRSSAWESAVFTSRSPKRNGCRRWQFIDLGDCESTAVYYTRGCTAYEKRRWSSVPWRWITGPYPEIGPEGPQISGKSGGR